MSADGSVTLEVHYESSTAGSPPDTWILNGLLGHTTVSGEARPHTFESFDHGSFELER